MPGDLKESPGSPKGVELSEFLDELARAMARPMSRRRALHVLGAAVVTTAVPGPLRTAGAPGATRGARGATRTTGPCPRPGYCPPNLVNCGVCPGRAPGSCYLAGCGQPGSVCCCLKDAAGKPSGAILCAPGYRCVPRGSVPCDCIEPCGPGVCCKPGETCANQAQRLCCKNEERGCGLECCKPNEECRRVGVGTASSRICVKRCPSGQPWCGRDKCCPPRWHCVNERTGLCKRCRRDEEECEKKCCNRRTHDCCGKAGCCPKSRFCCNTEEGRVCCPPRHKCAVPILRGNIGPIKGAKVICCPPQRLNNQPRLCCPPGQVALNSPGFRIPPPGISPHCCPPGQVCTSGGNKFCANLESDPSNCGSCGNVCASGICNGGICALP